MFGRSKPKISAPVSFKRERKYIPVPGAAAELPSPVKWQLDTKVGSFGRDAYLKEIDDSLAEYWKAKDGWGRLSLLGRLYFCCDFFLKNLSESQSVSHAHRASAVQGLFVTVVDKLCRVFDCSINFLPQMLEECWGRVLTPHGHHIDHQLIPQGGIPKIATYLDRSEVERFRMRFVGGRAQMRDRNDVSKWVIGDTTHTGWTYHPSIKDQMMEPGYAGFALSMGRDFYSAHHRGGFDEKNFFHSSYLSGNAVLCTGTWKIVGGVVKAIKNDSGHYQPTIDHLVNVIETLQMHGISPASVQVKAVAYSWSDDKGNIGTSTLVLDGLALLQRRNAEQRFRRRAHFNQINIADRQKLKTPGPIPIYGMLPDVPKPPLVPPRP